MDKEEEEGCGSREMTGGRASSSSSSSSSSSLAAILAIFLVLVLPFATSTPTNTTAIATADDGDKPTAYDLLEAYDFPIGLLPKGVKSYELDRENGKFYAHWDGSCSFSLEGSYELKYKSTISGYISKDKLTGLTGVSVKVLFFWLNIVEVTRRGDELEFSVGIASASFPIENFYECPQCGCGLDCVSGQSRKLKFKVNGSSVSSA